MLLTIILYCVCPLCEHVERRKNMRNNSKFVFAAFASTLLVLSACNQGPVRTLTGIEVTEEPVKVSYDYGEEFDARGLVISSVYSDETKEILPSTEYTLAGYDAFAPGEQEITVTYQPDKDNAEQVFTTSFNVTVAEAGIASIYIYAKPTKLEYERNESFDPAGLVVLAIYEDDSYDQIPSALLSLSKPDMSTSGKKTVTVTYGSFTESFEINVKVPTIKSLVVEVYPDKTTYQLNEQFSTKGLKVSYLMSDKSYDEVLNYDISYEEGVTPQNITSSYGVKKVNISVGKGEDKLETSFSISVIKPVAHTYNEYVTVSPSNWNELTYQDNNDTEIMSFIGGSFFNFNYEFEEGHEGDLNYIVDGGYQVEYDAVTKLEDVTADYAGDEKYSIPEKATKNYAYKFTLREDLKWDDGTPIKAEDFVYTMLEQENPDFFNYRADSFYNGDTIIHNAQNYLFQGSEGYFNARTNYEHYNEEDDEDLYFRSYAVAAYPEDSKDKMKDGTNTTVIDYELGNYPDELSYFAPGSYGVFIMLYFYDSSNTLTPTELAARSAALDGKSLAEIKADPTLNSYWELILNWWKTEADEELDFLVSHVVMPEVKADEVGIFVGDTDYELVVILDKELSLFKEDGKTLSYRAAYQFSSLPLVKKDLYEDCKVEPELEDGLWTSKYNSSVETTASWGPYKLTYFQAGKQFILDRNDNWYGYKMDKYDGQYETDRIVCDTIAQWNTAWLAFRQGDLASIGIDVSVADDYKGSSRAVYTASDFVSSMQLQSNKDAMKLREKEGVNKTLLSYPDFRAAISLSFDRAEYTRTCTTASLAGFGIFNSMHYYDVENGGVYRNTDYAKQVICEVYGVDVEDYDSLDEAYAAVTGLNVELAKQKLEAAYAAALEAGDINEGDTVLLTVGASEDTEAVRRQFNFIKKSLEELAKGTSLEGKLTAELNTSFGSKWANAFRAGEYDICTGGWTGAAWNPGYFLLAYLSPDYMYSKAWDTKNQKLTFNPYGDGTEEHTYTMGLLDWYACLNSSADAQYKWGNGGSDLPEEGATEFRLRIIAALEKEILKAYYTVPIAYSFSASLNSYKVESGCKTYNTFMGYGGIRHLHYNYTDAEWEPIKGTFDYKN